MEGYMTPRNFISERNQQERIISAARSVIDVSLSLALNCPPPSKDMLVSASPGDIVLGAVLWYQCDEDTLDGWPQGWFWKIVDEVDQPRDPYKAYTAHDGCRYGLDGAFVEV